MPDHIVDTDGRIPADTPCANCGYNLRTLPVGGVCPECAYPVAHSIGGYYLRFASPSWVRGLARGLLLILIGLGGAIFVGPALSGAIGLIVAVQSQTLLSPSTAYIRALAGLDFLITTSMITVIIAGMLCLTRPEPEPAAGLQGVAARRLARYGAFLLPVPEVCNLLLSFALPPMPAFSLVGPPPSFAIAASALADLATLGMVANLLGMTVGAAVPLALVRHLGNLLRRVPRPMLVRFAKIEFWGGLTSASVFVISGAAVFAAITPVMRVALMTLPTSTTLPATAAPAATGPSPGRPAVQSSSTPSTGKTPSGPATQAARNPSTTSGPAVASSVPTAGAVARPLLSMRAWLAMLVGGLALLSGIAGLGFAVGGIVLLAISCGALYAAAREAARNAHLRGAAQLLPAQVKCQAEHRPQGDPPPTA